MIQNDARLQALRQQIDEQDHALLELLSHRVSLANAIAGLKKEAGAPFHDPPREREILANRVQRGEALGLDGRFVLHLFRLILTHSLRRQEAGQGEAAAPLRVAPATAAKDPVPEPPAPAVKRGYRLVARDERRQDTVLPIGEVGIGGGGFVVIGGPCAVESEEQIQACAAAVKRCGGKLLRGGAFKPRTSPYSFQGLGYPGLRLLAQAGRDHGLLTVSEVMQPADVERVAAEVDVLQIGARNMQNYPLLSEAGKVDRPVLLKRGLAATIDEWLYAAEYILAGGNQRVILCERGIRTFASDTRFTLDLAAVPVLRERTHLPVIVDPSHAAGDWHYVTPLALAARAVACDGIMVEIHPDRSAALSDREQALSFEQFAELMELLRVPPARRDGVPAGGLAATAGVPLGGAAAAPAMSWAAAPLGSPPPAGC